MTNKNLKKKKKKLTDNYIQTYLYMTYMREGGGGGYAERN